MRKTALFLALVLMLTAVLFSCGEKQNNEKANDQNVVIAKDGKCEFTVIYPDRPTDAEKAAAIYIRDALKKISGAYVAIATDWVKDDSEIDSSKKEILVGNTNRQESADGLTTDIKVALSGNKIIVNGKDSNSIFYAAGAFVAGYIQNSEGADVLIPKDLKLEENVQTADGWMLYAMPVMEGVGFGEHSKSVTIAFNSKGDEDGNEYATVQYFTDVQRSEFDGYVEKLESYGFVVDSRTSYEDRHVVSLYRAAAGREHRYCLTLNGAELSISQIVPFDAQ